jgi:antitoxin (DNA-binding transcriptional repressor) of toxin-antitoxin stability system
VPDISATEAARSFSDVLDSVEHGNETYTIIRRGKAVAHLGPIGKGRGVEVRELLKRHRPDQGWSEELSQLRELVEIDRS